ncbi:hypothetical protein [Methylobacterium sp. J-076]|uniref:hypothetical protein n=1 Tax=Methylobacterium sp. J-076 TaxID=2836655 RepID=UPI001FB8EC8A|nr:hypothetical protein [Methylobacterium sp. J-076]MCJ2011154.1 hypothetical protein [Methylobacterium sp. J-076]
MLAVLAAGPARAEPALRLLDLPFKVREMRGPHSEVATAVATSGLLPLVRGGDGTRGSPPIAVVWGEEGGAILAVENGAVAVRPIGREAVEDLVASETPRGAVPGTRRALEGPLSAFLTGRTRGPDGGPAATTLTLRERQPLAVSTDPKPVPVATAAVPAGDGAVFAPRPPRIAALGGRPAVLAATLTGADAGGLVLIARPASDPAAWAVSARTAPGPRPALAALGDFSGKGLQAATVDSTGRLTLWNLAPDRIEPGPEAAGYTLGDGEADLADTLAREGGADLALPVAGMPALAIVSARDGLRERLRVALPAPVGTGVAALGEGAGARLVVGLGDGRVAAIALDGGTP